MANYNVKERIAKVKETILNDDMRYYAIIKDSVHAVTFGKLSSIELFYDRINVDTTVEIIADGWLLDLENEIIKVSKEIIKETPVVDS